MSDISFRSSALPVYETCPRMFAANYLMATKQAKDFGADLRPTKQNIGAAIGTSVHDAHAFLMNALAQTGDHGGTARTTAAIEVASSSYETITKGEGVGMDGTTPNDGAAERAIAKMVRTMHANHRPSSQPVLIEKGFKSGYTYTLAGLRVRVIVTGTIDLYLLEERLPDLKTGRNRPVPYVQLGTYDNILSANDIPVSQLEAIYIPRVATSRTQPPPEIIPIHRRVAKEQAKLVAVHAHRDISLMLTSGHAQNMIPRPNHGLCDPRFCSAFGTNFCAIGAAVNSHKKGRK